MLEAFLLLIAVMLIPRFDESPLWAAVAALLVIPGMYATWTGAPFVPTSMRIVRRMVELAGIKSGDVVYDLGCGDGRIVFEAARAGANATGFEYSVPTFLLGKFRSLFHRRSRIRYANFWKQDYRNADVIFCYLLTDSMQVFERVVWPQLKPGCRVVSHTFKMRGVEPTHRETDITMYEKP